MYINEMFGVLPLSFLYLSASFGFNNIDKTFNLYEISLDEPTNKLLSASIIYLLLNFNFLSSSKPAKVSAED